MTGQRWDKTEHHYNSWRPYRRPDDETGQTTGQQLLPINETLFSCRGDGTDINPVGPTLFDH